MKKQNVFLSAALTVLVMSLAAFGMVSCDNDPGPGTPPGLSVPGPGNLPNFPEGATPATAENVGDVLEELTNSGLIADIVGEIDGLIPWENFNDTGNLQLKDKAGDNTKVTANGKTTESLSKNLEDVLGGTSSTLKTGDSARYTYNLDILGTLTNKKTEDSVSILQGGTYAQLVNQIQSLTVTKGGNLETMDGLNITFSAGGSYKQQDVAAFTAVTSQGSVKIILNLTWTQTGSATVDISKAMSLYGGDDYSDIVQTKDTYSGSLKIYGAGNKLILGTNVNNDESYFGVLNMLGLADASSAGGGPSIKSPMFNRK